MQLQLSLSPLPVRLVKDRQHGSHIATTLAALTGATGCLPPCYEETALAQTLNRNDSYAAFIALFQRNLADLLVEASAKYSAHRQSRRTQPAQNPFSNAILALAGCEHRDEKNEPQLFAMQYAALFADDRRNAESLKAMLTDIFGIPIEIAEFQPRWQPVPEDERSFLNGRSRLGADSCIGASARNAAAYFRVILGPLDYSQFRRFLPDQPEAQQLADLIRFYCGFGLSFDVQLVLEKLQCFQPASPQIAVLVITFGWVLQTHINGIVAMRYLTSERSPITNHGI